MTVAVVLVVVVVAAGVVGLVLRRREGRVRTTSRPASDDVRRHLEAAGVESGTVTVLHFSASWCGPCAAVRRVTGSVVDGYGSSPTSPADVEVDIGDHPELARLMGVMSLPTTVVLGRDLTERSRITGVPSAADLRAAIGAAE